MAHSLFQTIDYIDFVNTIKSRIRDARIAASRKVNKELIHLY